MVDNGPASFPRAVTPHLLPLALSCFILTVMDSLDTPPLDEDDVPSPGTVHFSAKDPTTWAKPEEMTWGDWALQPGRPLSARHRRLAEFLSMGMRTSVIAEKLDLTEARVSLLKSNTLIRQEVAKIQERIFEETHTARLKAMGHDALDVVHEVLNDRTGKAKVSEKLDAAKWVTEKLTGKATQTLDVGENLLGLMMDKLDAMKGAGKTLTGRSVDVTASDTAAASEIVISEDHQLSGEADASPVTPLPPRVLTEEEELVLWVTSNG